MEIFFAMQKCWLVFSPFLCVVSKIEYEQKRCKQKCHEIWLCRSLFLMFFAFPLLFSWNVMRGRRRRALWDYLVHHNTISCKRNLGNINCKMFSIIIISNMKDLKILDPNQTTTIARNDLITSCCTTFQVSETPLYPPFLKHNNNNTNISC